MKTGNERKGQGQETNPFGMDQRIFNVIFTLVTGSPTLGSGHKALDKMDIWDFQPGVDFFKDLLYCPSKFKIREKKRLRRSVRCA